MNQGILKSITFLFLAVSLFACGGEGGDHLFDNPYDLLFNDQPDTTFVSISSASRISGTVEKNPVTLGWSGTDSDGIEGYYYKMDNDDWSWTTETFTSYSTLGTGIHTFSVKAKDNVGATDNTPAEKSFEVDATPPTVSFTVPKNSVSGVAVNASVAATFSEMMVDFTNSTSVLTLEDGGGGEIDGAVRYDHTTATFDPTNDLDYGTTYTAKISTGATDEVGNPMASEYSWSFITGAASDKEPPQVSSTTLARNETEAIVNSAITVTFAEPLAAFSITTSTFTLVDDSFNPVAGTVFYSGVSATFTPFTSLSYDTDYTATITTGATDLADNPLAEYIWSFSTGSDPNTTPPDTTSPMVTSTSPVNGDTDVAANSAITATFSEPVDPATITTFTFKVKDNNNNDIIGSVYYSGITAAFTPHTSLDYSKSYVATITTGVKDIAGNALSSDYIWSFTTGVAPDTEAPTVSSTSPKNNATGVAANSAITAMFNEPMDAYTISTATFTLWDNDSSTDVSGSVTYSGTTAAFTPFTTLAYETSYTAKVATGVTDIAGNALGSDYIWSFTTGAEPDTTPPVVMWTTPFNNATGVDIETVVTATFSESMDASTITTETFGLKDSGNVSVSGAVTYSGSVATFTPLTSLDFDMNYTATVTTGVKDSAGNPMQSNYSWSFSTGDDTVPPSIVSTNPASDETNVPYDASVIVKFSEPMDGSTINTGSFILEDSGLNLIDGNVYYDGNVTAIFTPLSTLPYGIEYTATVTRDVKDVAGNTLDGNTFEEDYVWSFKVVDAPDTTPPTVIFTNPSSGEMNVSTDDPRIFITFSEPMDSTTLTTATISVSDSFGNISGNVYYDGVVTALFKPLNDLTYATTYSATVVSGAAGAKDLAGNAMEAPDKIWSFRTGSIPISIANSIAGGFWHSLAIKSDLTAWAWGYNTDGQLGDGTLYESSSPVAVSTDSGLTDVMAMAAGEFHSLALSDDKGVWAWGANVNGQLGNGSTEDSLTPAQVPELTDVIAIAAGASHSMALKSDGTVWTWGSNSDGQLGDGANLTDEFNDDLYSPQRVLGLLEGKTIVAIAAGDYHSMALSSDGVVYTWGENLIGQLGDGTVNDDSPYGKSLPVQVSGLINNEIIVDIAAGHRHSVAVTNDGNVWTWGMNWFGQLGYGTSDTDPHPVPDDVAGLTNIQAVAGGTYHTLALTNDNYVYAWGLNDDGQLGNDTTTSNDSPVQVLGVGGTGNLSNIVAIAGGAHHSIALQSGGTVYTWGYNEDGELGNGISGVGEFSSTPVQVSWP